MSNMSYCRYQNTLRDLEDCYDVMEDDPKSQEERSARLALIRLCCNIAREYGGMEDEE